MIKMELTVLSSLARPYYECQRRWIAIHCGLKLGRRVNLSPFSVILPLRRMKSRRLCFISIGLK